MRIFKNYVTLFWIAQTAFLLVKIIFAFRPEINLFTEEAQYWLWSQNLAWHYYSKPPMVAVTNFLSTSLFGINEFAIRIVPAILGIGSAWLIFQLADLLFQSKKIAFWASMILISMPFFLLFSTFHMTDSELTFFWILTWYLLAKALKEKQIKWWVFAGVSAAFGLASKPVILLIIPILGFYLFLKKDLKTNSKEFVVFGLVFMLGFLPSLIWNMQNGFLTFKHIATLGGVEGEKEARTILDALKSFSEFIGSQLAMISIFMIPVVWVGVKRFKKQPVPDALFLLLPALVPFVAFGALSFLTEIQANWIAFSYPTLAVFFAYLLSENSLNWKKYQAWAVGLGVGLPLILLLPEAFGWKKVTGVEKVELAAFRRMAGYDQIAQRVIFLQDSLKAKDPFFFSESYHVSSELAFYLPDHPQTYQAAMGARRNQFDLWESLDTKLGKEGTGVFVSLHEESSEKVTQFEELIYEEEFPIYFRDVYLRSAKIQFWKNLEKYSPIHTGAY